MSQNLRDVEPRVGIVMGLLFFGAGTAVVLIALDWIHVDPSSIHAPRWVLAVCGVMFALPGVGALFYGIRNGLTGGPRPRPERDGFSTVGWLIGLVIMCGMTAVVSWVAFGPGERVFGGGIGIGGVGVGGRSSETLGRVVFGAGAVLSGIVTIWGLIYGLRRLSDRDPASRRERES